MRAALLATLTAAVAAAPIRAQTIAIVDVGLADLEAREVLPSRTVIVRDGVIDSIGPTEGPAPEGIDWIDGEGLFLVPGRVETLAEVPSGAFERTRRPGESRDRVPGNPLDWHEELLVRVAHGVTTLGLGVADRRELERIRNMIPVMLPAPRLVHLEEASEIPRRIEVGARADLLLVDGDPTLGVGSSGPPLAVIIGGLVHTRADFEMRALSAARMRRSWQMRTVPGVFVGRDRTWRASCEPSDHETCFGGDPDCGFWHVLAYFSRTRYDCGAATYPADRRATLESLDRLAELAPTSGWIAGQRVRIALVDGEFQRAMETAQGCRADGWWCQALRGLVLHTERAGTGGLAFDSAYANAPEGALAWHPSPIPGAGDRGVACEWSDLSYLIEDEALRGEYDIDACGEREAFEARYWWLADPLWSQPGNPRRDEHHARNVTARLRDDFLRAVRNVQRFHGGEESGKNHAHCIPVTDHRIVDWWPPGQGIGTYSGGHMREQCISPHRDLIRIGEPNAWRGVRYDVEPAGWRFNALGNLTNPTPGSECNVYKGAQACTFSPNPQLREGHLHGGYRFTPRADAFRSPETSTADDWALTWNEGHERMLTPETWHNLDHQVAVLRRGDELRILAASAFPTPIPAFDSLEAFLAIGRASDQRVEVARAAVDRTTGVMRADISLPEDAWIASVEALAPEVRGRARLGARAPSLEQGFGISRPVLTEPEFDPERDELLAAMLPAVRVPAEGRVGLYAELHGVEVGQTVRMSLTYDPGERERSLLGRIAGVFGIGGGDPDPVRLEWTEQLERVEDGVGRVFVTTDLGDHDDVELEITMSAVVGDRRAAERITLRPRR